MKLDHDAARIRWSDPTAAGKGEGIGDIEKGSGMSEGPRLGANKIKIDIPSRLLSGGKETFDF